MDFKENKKRIEGYIHNPAMRKYYNFLGVRGSERPGVKVTINPIGTEGTSYTDCNNITLTIWEQFWNSSLQIIKEALEATTGHEAEHIRSSSISDMKKLSDMIGLYYYNKYQIDKRVGQKLGATLYNIVEDGRIERIYTNRFPGTISSFHLINGVIWRLNTIDVNEQNRSQYSDFISAILCIAKTGVKPKGWDEVYANTEADNCLADISADIYEIVNSNLTEEVIKGLLVINDKISDFIKEGLEKDSDFLKQLDDLSNAGYDVDNSTEKQQGQASSNGGSGSSAHIGGGNQPGSGSGSSSVQDAVEQGNAQAQEKTPEDIEKELAENEANIEQDTSAQEMIEKGEAEAAKEAAENQDDEITDKEINKIAKDYDVDIDGVNITSYQNGITDVNAIEPNLDIQQRSLYIYNQLKKLFLKRDNKDIRNLKRGRLDSRKLAKYSALAKTSSPEVNIFKKNQKNVIPDVAVLGLADISGSTSGALFEKIMNCLAICEGGFAPLLPLKLMTYEGGYGHPNINVLKDFKNKIKRINYSYTFSKCGRAGGGTPTAEAMAIGGYELSKRKEKQKLLFIITDGEPNDSDAVLKITKDLRHKGIKVIAILVQDRPSSRTEESFKKMYDDKDFITASEDEFSSILIKIISSWVQN